MQVYTYIIIIFIYIHPEVDFHLDGDDSVLITRNMKYKIAGQPTPPNLLPSRPEGLFFKPFFLGVRFFRGGGGGGLVD